MFEVVLMALVKFLEVSAANCTPWLPFYHRKSVRMSKWFGWMVGWLKLFTSFGGGGVLSILEKSGYFVVEVLGKTSGFVRGFTMDLKSIPFYQPGFLIHICLVVCSMCCFPQIFSLLWFEVGNFRVIFFSLSWFLEICEVERHWCWCRQVVGHWRPLFSIRRWAKMSLCIQDVCILSPKRERTDFLGCEKVFPPSQRRQIVLLLNFE